MVSLPFTVGTPSIPDWLQGRRACASYGVAAVGLALLWQFLTVSYNFGGNWSALFLTSQRWAVPEPLETEEIYRFRGTYGYDAQFYHYIAHDPFFAQEFGQNVDDPRLRYNRILVPGIAFVSTLGNQDLIDIAYRATILGFLFLGVYWLSRYAAQHGKSAAWGLFFVVIPAAAISVERLTIDIALAALCAGYGLYTSTRENSKLALILFSAPLARETGLAVILSHACYLAISRRWKAAVLTGVSVVPYLGWVVFVASQTPKSQASWISPVPLAGLITRTLEVFPVEVIGTKEAFAAALDYVGLLGVWLALLFTAGWLRRERLAPLAAAAATFVLVAVFLSNSQVWYSAYAFSRLFSPWFLFLAMAGLATGRPVMLLPALFSLPRIAVQYGTQLIGIAGSLLG